MGPMTYTEQFEEALMMRDFLARNPAEQNFTAVDAYRKLGQALEVLAVIESCAAEYKKGCTVTDTQQTDCGECAIAFSDAVVKTLAGE